MILGSNRPCRKCGAMDRNKHGQCSPCKRKYYQTNREKAIEQQRKYYEANREKAADSQRKYYQANPEKIAECKRKWHEANREKIAERKREYYEANFEKFKANNHNRRAKIKGNGGKLSPDIVQTLMTLQKGKCACCGKSLKQGYHLDHIMPIALGGKNTDDNIQLLTPKCNLSKGPKHPINYMRSKGKLI